MDSSYFLPMCPSVLAKKEPEPSINDFELLADIGSGGYGKVFLYRHKMTKCEYAIKQIDKSKFKTPPEKEMFIREVEIMYSINHPNIVKLYSHFEDDSYCYLIMEYIKKGNLYNYVQQFPNCILDDKSTCQIVVELCSALYYLHNIKGKAIIHRDVKPENCLIGDNNEMKLGDFGGSNYYIQNKRRFTTCGTRPYHSPEMILNKGYGPSVDIWAVGVLIYELKCGYPPFSTNDYTLENNVLNLRIKFPKDIDEDVKDLITKILKLQPEERLTLKEIVSHKYITKFQPNGISKFIEAEEVKNLPYILSRVPHYEDEDNRSTAISLSGLEEYKEMYDKMKYNFDRLSKSYEELKNEKNELEARNKKEIDFLTQAKNGLANDLDSHFKTILAQKKTIAKLEEENRQLKEKEGLLKQQFQNELAMANESYKMQLEAFKKENAFYQEKSAKHSQAMSEEISFTPRSMLEQSPSTEEKNLINFYMEENKKLTEDYDKLKKRYFNLEEKVEKAEKNHEIIDNRLSLNLMNKLKEQEIKIAKKDRRILKLNNILESLIGFTKSLNIEQE